MPNVTVSLQTYNRPSFLKQAIEAVLAQTYTDFEFLICDNGSDAETVEVIRSFTDPRIRHIRNEVNDRAFANKPFEIAQGEYLLITHDDDQMHPGLVAREVQELDAHPRCVAVGCNVNWIDEANSVTSRRHLPITETVVMQQHEYLKYHKQGLVLYHPTVMMRKSFFNSKGLKYEYRVGPGADTYFWFNALKYPVELRLMDEVLFNYRIHPTQGSVIHNLTMDVQLFEAILSDTKGDSSMRDEAQRATTQLLYFYFAMWEKGQLSKEEYRQKMSLISSTRTNFRLSLRFEAYKQFPSMIKRLRSIKSNLT